MRVTKTMAQIGGWVDRDAVWGDSVCLQTKWSRERSCFCTSIVSISILMFVHINVSVCLSTPGAAEACLCPILKHLDWAEIKGCGSWINWTALVPDGDYKLLHGWSRQPLHSSWTNTADQETTRSLRPNLTKSNLHGPSRSTGPHPNPDSQSGCVTSAAGWKLINPN